MSPERDRNSEKIIGSSCYEAINEIIRVNPQIAKMSFREYFYIPRTFDSEKTNIDFYLTPQEFVLGDEINNRLKNLPEGWNIAVCSNVFTKDNSELHIPMMDFKCQPNSENLSKVIEGLKTIVLEKDGFLLKTDNSYHYYGTHLLTLDKWWNFLGRCLLTNGMRDKDQSEDLVDERYIGYRILSRHCALRITTNKDKAFLPEVVVVI